VVDAGPLVAAVNDSERNHLACAAVLRRRDIDMVIPALVLAEACYLIEQRLGPLVEATFLRNLGAFDIEAPAPDDWSRMAALVGRYADFPLGAADASVIALAERLGTDTLI